MGVDPCDTSQFSPTEIRPLVKADIDVNGTAPSASDNPGGLTISGLLIDGTITVVPGNLGALHIADTTLVPRAPSLLVQSTGPDNRNFRLEALIERCIMGGIQVDAPVPTFRLVDTIVNGGVAGAALPPDFNRCTVTGAVTTERIDASDSIFMGGIQATRTQVGCGGFSFFPAPSRVPRAYRCQPALAVEESTIETESHIRARMTPSYVSTDYGQPGYMQLAETCSPEILIGASNGDEMGAFNRELHSLREANLRFAMTEYLRVGLEAGIFHSN